MRNRSDRDSPRDRCLPPRLLSVAAVADRLDVSTKTVRRWIAAGALRIHRLGRSVRIGETDLQKFLEDHRQ